MPRGHTHKTLLSWLSTYSVDLADLVQCYTVLAEQATVYDEVTFTTFWRQDGAS